MPGEAIARYHELLTDELGGETQAQIDTQLRERGLYFGDRPLCTVLRPRFFTPAQYGWMRVRAGLILRAFERVHNIAIADSGFRAQYKLQEWEEELVTVNPGFRNASPTSRLDAFFVNDGKGLRFTEYNAETPAGSGYNDVLTEMFLGLPVMREFLRSFEVRPLPVRHSLMHCLLDAFRQWKGRAEAPRIAIIDWSDVPTYSEFVIFEQYFAEQGLECIIADPRELEYQDGRLMAGDYHITLIYKRVLISELVERGGMDHPIIRAVRDGAVCMVNPFACKINHKKASLAVLTDERNASLFPADEQRAIADHVPWTRVVEERKTRFDNREVDLVPFSVENRERLVLKPNDEYGGKGIVLGWEVSASEWAAAVQTALAEPYIVQERIILPKEPYPSMADGHVVIADRMLDTAPYAFYGDYVDGCLSRLGTTSLLNVTSGGGSNVPSLLAEKR
ncbi:MAG: circularly permuted type 2 ATP-grasp protein [Anaerolineae bacterium]|nr:circularly permuted type 2 ATP-grasp protein [Gemmatimonadaceae bacterium]